MRIRGLSLVLMTVMFALPLAGQDSAGWSLSGRFQGSSNSDGMVLKADPTLGYSFNRHFQTYLGVPVYFVNESSTIQTQTASTGGFMSGLGNAYIGFRLGVDNDAVNYSSTLEGTAPTGDKAKGFSTGRATVDWTNRFSLKLSSVTPFASAGLANTVSDTSFFVRPFTSLGMVTHFDGGAKFSLSRFVDAGASAYAVRAAGQQTIVSKIFKDATTPTATTAGSGKNRPFENGHEVVGSAALANDNGFSTWLAAHTGSTMDFQIGYTRSAGYDLNTLFFGVGFRVGK
jgi:hypothetical protein